MKTTDITQTPNPVAKETNDIQPAPRLRRVVDMSQLNAQKAKPASAKTNRNDAKTKTTRARANKQTSPAPDETRDPQDAKHPSASQPAVRRVRKTARTAMTEMPAAQVQVKRRLISRANPLYEAKTTRLTAPPPARPKAGDSAAENEPGTAPKTQPKPAVRYKTYTTSATKTDSRSSKARKNSLKIQKSPIRRQKEESDSLQLKVQEHISESLLLQSWRSKQWGATLATFGDAFTSMLPRCMPLVQARFVNNICIAPGRLESTVVDEITSIEIRQFTLGQWRAVISMLSDRAIFTTSLLNGELPEGILDTFKQASLSLFPTKMREFAFTCTCGSETTPCEHACALLLAFAQCLEEDPFNIMTLRGVTREKLLSLLRDARSDQVVDEKSRHHINYEIPAQNIDFNDFYAPKGQFGDLTFHISYTPNTLIRRLGTPRTWTAPASLESVMMPLIETAARDAENLGLSERYQLDLTEEESRMIATAQEPVSRAPRKTTKSPRFVMPDLGFVATVLPREILETVPDDPVATAEDIIRWLKTKGASDIRTLARRTRLHKPTIEAFLNEFCDAGLVRPEGENEKLRFEAIF